MLELKLPEFDYCLRKKNDKLEIYDIVRKKYVVLSPEEWVRQHFIHYLKNFKSVPINLISIEKGARLNRMSKRTDIVVFNQHLKPVLLVECKSPYEELIRQAPEQIIRYNQVIHAPYLALTNGIMHYYWYCGSNGEYIQLDELPDLFGLLFDQAK